MKSLVHQIHGLWVRDYYCEIHQQFHKPVYFIFTTTILRINKAKAKGSKIKRKIKNIHKQNKQYNNYN